MFRRSILLIVLACVFTPSFQSEAERHKVIVVGAGVSGFTAAATLLEHNVTDVLVLEAADRIGGRVNTVQFGGVPIDKGAEFVLGQVNNTVYDLVKPHDLVTSYTKLLRPDMFLFSNATGTTFKSPYVHKLYADAYKIFDEEGIKHVSGSVADYFNTRLDEFLRSKNVEPQVGEGVRYLVSRSESSTSAVDELSDLGAWGFADSMPSLGDINLKWKPGTKGYETIFDIISKKFPNPSEELPVLNKTLLGKEVTRVVVKEGYVEVTCTDGSSYLADHVIVTVSLGVLKKHAATMFHPTLPAEKTAAIEALGFGCLGKVFLLFPTRWWPNDINAFMPLWTQKALQDFKANSVYGNWSSLTSGFLPVINHDRMLRVTVSGRACHHLNVLSEEQVIDALMELLDKLMGKKFDIPRPESILRTEWGSYPFTLGSYSFRSVESDSKNISNSYLATPIFNGEKPVVLFAGEATNRDHPVQVNGALDTGRREAFNVINYLNKQT